MEVDVEGGGRKLLRGDSANPVDGTEAEGVTNSLDGIDRRVVEAEGEDRADAEPELTEYEYVRDSARGDDDGTAPKPPPLDDDCPPLGDNSLPLGERGNTPPPAPRGRRLLSKEIAE